MNIYEEVKHERKKQDLKWGVQDHTLEHWLIILGEEFGEACNSILEKQYWDCRDELIQIAAVAIAAVESHDRYMRDSV